MTSLMTTEKKTCDCSWPLPATEIVVIGGDESPPQKVIAILVCPNCGNRHIHQWLVPARMYEIPTGTSN